MAYSGEQLRRIAELVDAETRRQGRPRVRERLERQIERGMRVVRDPRDVNLGRHVTASTNGAAASERPVHDDRACRTEDCENRANATYARGALAGLCWEICVPAKRQEMSEHGKRRYADRAVRVLEPPAVRVLEGPPGRLPEPELPTMDDAAPEEREPSLADLAADLERARLIFDDAEEAYEQAVERFLEHPLVRELDVGYPASE